MTAVNIKDRQTVLCLETRQSSTLSCLSLSSISIIHRPPLHYIPLSFSLAMPLLSRFVSSPSVSISFSASSVSPFLNFPMSQSHCAVPSLYLWFLFTVAMNRAVTLKTFRLQWFRVAQHREMWYWHLFLNLQITSFMINEGIWCRITKCICGWEWLY